MTAVTTPVPATAGGRDERPVFRPPAPLGVRAEEVDPGTQVGVSLRQVERYRDRLMVRIKREDRWLPVSWREMGESAAAVAAALVRSGVAHGDRVAILSENRLEWLHADTGAQLAGAVVVPVYASSIAETVGQILADSGAITVFCSSPKQAAKVLEVRGSCPALRDVVVFDGAADGCTAFSDFLATATAADTATVDDRARALRPENPLTIIYTSGTTGVPKGVVLTNANIVESCRSMLERVPIDEDEEAITFLPWAHVYERVQGLYAGQMAGVTASIANSLDDIGADLRSVRPVLMNGVPRLYEKMQEAIMAQVRASGGRNAAIGLRAIDECVQRARLRRQGERVPIALELRCRLWERLVLNRVRAGLGGRARVFSSGGGPINIATLEFFDALGVAITEGYGLTETTGGITANDPAAPRFGTVGRPTRGHEIRIAEDGEILVKGPAVMAGYFNNPTATAEVLKDGWFTTGDIGEVDADGYLRITDRKKDLIVTAGGKNIAPQPIEAAIMQDPLVERACVIGDRRKYLVALVVPNFGALRDWARQNGVEPSLTDEELARDPKVAALYTSIAERCSARLARYETIKKVAVLERDFDEQRGEMTPTLKVKRKVVQEHFGPVIEDMYSG